MRVFRSRRCRSRSCYSSSRDCAVEERQRWRSCTSARATVSERYTAHRCCHLANSIEYVGCRQAALVRAVVSRDCAVAERQRWRLWTSAPATASAIIQTSVDTNQRAARSWSDDKTYCRLTNYELLADWSKRRHVNFSIID